MRRAAAFVAATALVVGGGCDVVFGLDEPGEARGDRDAGARDGALDDGALAVDAPPDAPEVLPGCWATSQVVGTLPASKYRLGPGAESWAAAKARCEVDGAHLVVVSHLDSEWAQLGLAGGAFVSPFWTGATDAANEGVWASVTGEPVQLGAFSAWTAGEPNAGTATEDCAVSFANLGANLGLYDADCASTQPALCECELPVTCPQGLVRYTAVSGSYTWDQAAGVCAGQGMALARLASGLDVDRALTVLGGNARYWIDARDAATEGDWRDTSGCRPYMRWLGAVMSGNEPNGGVGENCAAITLGYIADLSCSLPQNVLCEGPP